MKMELFHFSAKKKKRKDQDIGELESGARKSESDTGDTLFEPDLMDKVVSGMGFSLTIL